jgi:plastocyanin
MTMRLGRIVLGTALGIAVLACGTVKSPTENVNSGTTVQASNFVFTPATLTVKVGTAVTWVNTGGFHNVTADDGAFICANGCNDTGGNGGPASNNWSFTRVLTVPGALHYHCVVHGAPGGVGMSGTINVTP